jgi:hypothetical protein
MAATRLGTLFGYTIAGSTGSAGAATMMRGAEPVIHTIYGFPLSEVALIVGIMGTFATVLFQYLNYRNIRKIKKNSKTLEGDNDENGNTE